MPEIASGVEFEHIAREWRCKWSSDGGGASIIGVQEFLDQLLGVILAFCPNAEVQRIVCGYHQDFKVITIVPHDEYKAWEDVKFSPEEKFLESIKSSYGVSQVETQTYTIASLTGHCPDGGELIEKWPGVFYNRMGREWRCKWSNDDDKASLVGIQKVVDKYLPQLKTIPDVQVQRIVCGGNLDFKLITSVPAENFQAFQDGGFCNEKAFMKDLSCVKGVSRLEEQSYTIQPISQIYGTIDMPEEPQEG